MMQFPRPKKNSRKMDQIWRKCKSKNTHTRFSVNSRILEKKNQLKKSTHSTTCTFINKVW